MATAVVQEWRPRQGPRSTLPTGQFSGLFFLAADDNRSVVPCRVAESRVRLTHQVQTRNENVVLIASPHIDEPTQFLDAGVPAT